MGFAAVSLLLLDPIAERVLAGWELVRKGHGGGPWSLGGWAVDEHRLRAIVEADAVTLTDTLERLGSMDLLDEEGSLRREVVAYLGRKLSSRLGVRAGAKKDGTA